jgi:FdhD protein
MFRPAIAQAAHPASVIVEAVDEHGAAVPTAIACERPLTLYLDKCELVTLMTLGQAPEALAIGYLRNQSMVKALDEIAAVQVDWETGSVAVTTHHGIRGLDERMARRTVTTGCGQGTVFGDMMEELDRVRLPDDAVLAEATLTGMLEAVRHHDSLYKQAGAVHGCTLARNEPAGAQVLYFVEDVGRHNAVDAIAGAMWLDGIDGADKIFYTTGRLTSEMVIKTVRMGIPFLVSRSGLTQMGYDIARRAGLTMIGRAQGRHFLLFTGHHRFRRCSAAGTPSIAAA